MTKTAASSPSVAPPAGWGLLRRGGFRSVWSAFFGSQLVVWMHQVGAVTVVASLSDSATLIALVQTATSLPAVALSLVIGATADIVDRRRLVLAAQAWMATSIAALAALTLGDAVDAATVLALTLALGAGMATSIIAYQALTPEFVSREELPQAVALNGVAINLARALGPAIAGLLIVALSAGALFAIEAAGVLLLMVVVFRLRTPEQQRDEGEQLGSAVRAGARYVRFSPLARPVLVRAALFSLGASALWSLLPVVAVGPLALDSRGLGLLMGCVGTGAIIGASVLPRLRRRLPLDLLVAGATVALAGGLCGLAWLREPALIGAVLVVTGAAWLGVLSSLNTAAQRAAPGWVRARTLASFQLVFQGCLAMGSLAWGVTAGAAGVRTALLAAAAVLILGSLAARRWPLWPGEEVDLSPAASWSHPELSVEPAPSDGPVLVTLEYRVLPERAEEFVAAMQELGRVRRRDGAIAWDLYEDLEDPGRYLETFTVASWSEHMRQHGRRTVSDLELERRVDSLHVGDEPPPARHLLWAPAALRARRDAEDQHQR
jgi:MFS family permease/quinol monooxygenase YgiN